MNRFERCIRHCLAAWLLVLVVPSSVLAQDLYDPATLRTFNIVFHDANWLQLLRQNYSSETLILADLEVEGVTYPNVGVRIRGNTSYTSLPTGSEKFSLKINMDHVDPNQALMGYDNINLNNGFRDPTFMREVVFNNYVAQFIPNPRANHVRVTLNEQDWGVYINVQQGNKRMLRDYFADADGMRVTCSNNPNGPGLRYNGTNAAGYSAYEFNSDGGLANPLQAFIDVTYALTNEPLATWQNIDGLFAIDPSIWSIALENLFVDDDSYIGKGCDFTTYRDPVDGRLHLLQRDGNETFGNATWAVTHNFANTARPVLNRVLSVAELRQRYLAHYRRLLEDFNWDYFGPRFTQQRALIESAVQADPKKIYSYQNFQNNFASTVNLGISGLGGGSLIGLQQFVTQRRTTLNANAELVAVAPTITSQQASDAAPAPGDSVWISADVTPPASGIEKVELFYRPNPTQRYSRVQMLDDGNSGDGAAGDGRYGVLLPLSGISGQRVSYYVAASANNSYKSVSYLPALSERGPAWIEYGLGDAAAMRISEWMYSGDDGEFIEFSNTGDTPIDMSGWSFDDAAATPGTFDLSAFGTVQPGESVVLTENTADAFRLAWGLNANVKIIGELGVVSGNNLGRSDQIHLYDGNGALVDRLYYGDQTYVDSIRTNNASGQAPCSAFGQNDVYAWVRSALGDVYGSIRSVAGDVGTPGRAVLEGCDGSDPARVFSDGFEAD